MTLEPQELAQPLRRRDEVGAQKVREGRAHPSGQIRRVAVHSKGHLERKNLMGESPSIRQLPLPSIQWRNLDHQSTISEMIEKKESPLKIIKQVLESRLII